MIFPENRLPLFRIMPVSGLGAARIGGWPAFCTTMRHNATPERRQV
jgi:hypothetical protein